MSKLVRRSVSSAHASAAAEEPLELENHFVLRLPAETAVKVREWLQEGGAAFKDRVSIQFHQDMRHAQVRVDGETFYGKLVDLPCVVETLKTLDKKTFYKVADVSQMLVCKTEPDEAEEDQKQKQKNEQQVKDPKKKDKQYQWPHGITEPLKNVRKRRFRKTLKKKYMDAPELEKELKRLLREDMEAVKVRWEIVSAEQEAQQKMKAQKQKHQLQEDRFGPSTSGAAMAAGGETLSRVQELFGGALSSSSEGEVSDADLVLESDGELDTTLTSAAETPRFQRESESATNTVQGEYDEDAEVRELAQHLAMTSDADEQKLEAAEVDSESLRMRIVQLQSELMQIEKTRRNYESQLAQAETSDANELLQQEIHDLMSRDKEIRDEVCLLKREIQRKP